MTYFSVSLQLCEAPLQVDRPQDWSQRTEVTVVALLHWEHQWLARKTDLGPRDLEL